MTQVLTAECVCSSVRGNECRNFDCISKNTWLCSVREPSCKQIILLFRLLGKKQIKTVWAMHADLIAYVWHARKEEGNEDSKAK
ncbi:hypothetical protein L7F22_068506, partial [Adiantum nelumboides]|nr:hypothetical protein [Adiantum nelumboides]